MSCTLSSNRRPQLKAQSPTPSITQWWRSAYFLQLCWWYWKLTCHNMSAKFSTEAEWWDLFCPRRDVRFILKSGADDSNPLSLRTGLQLSSPTQPSCGSKEWPAHKCSVMWRNQQEVYKIPQPGAALACQAHKKRKPGKFKCKSRTKQTGFRGSPACSVLQHIQRQQTVSGMQDELKACES